jgi:ribosomal protein L34
MVWEREPSALKAKRLTPFRFRVESPDGKRALAYCW